MFFYLNGFALGDGNLKTSAPRSPPLHAQPPLTPLRRFCSGRSVPGSHLFKTDTGHGREDADIMKWAEGKVHPVTGEALAVRRLECPPRSVVVMWTQ